MGSKKYGTQIIEYLEFNNSRFPEERLLRAFLSRMITDYLGNDLIEHRVAMQWLHSEYDPNDGIFSFHYICDTIGVDPEALLTAINNYGRRK